MLQEFRRRKSPQVFLAGTLSTWLRCLPFQPRHASPPSPPIRRRISGSRSACEVQTPGDVVLRRLLAPPLRTFPFCLVPFSFRKNNFSKKSQESLSHQPSGELAPLKAQGGPSNHSFPGDPSFQKTSRNRIFGENGSGVWKEPRLNRVELEPTPRKAPSGPFQPLPSSSSCPAETRRRPRACCGSPALPALREMREMGPGEKRDGTKSNPTLAASLLGLNFCGSNF